MPTLEQLERELEEKKAAGREILAKEDIDVAAKQEQFKALNLDDLNAQIGQEKSLEVMRKGVEQMGDVPATSPESSTAMVPNISNTGLGANLSTKGIGDLFCGSDTYTKSVGMSRKQGWSTDTINLKATLVSQASGDAANAFIVDPQQIPGVLPVLFQRLTIANIIPGYPTSNPSARLTREGASIETNAASVVGEGQAKPQQDFDFENVTEEVHKIAVTAKVSDETFDDIPFMRSYLNTRMGQLLLRRHEQQLLTGTGVNNDFPGILRAGSGIQTQARGTDSNADAIFKAIVKIQTATFDALEPDYVVINPANWQTIRLTKDSAGQYLAGGPHFQQYGNGTYVVPGTVWGLPVIVTQAITANTVLVGAFGLGALRLVRAGISMDATNSNEDDFKNDLVCLRAEMREGLFLIRPSAFCTVTSAN